MRKAVPCAVLALLLSLPAASAEQGEARLEAAGLVPLWGEVRVAPEDGRVLHASPGPLGTVPLVRITVVSTQTNASGQQETRETFAFADAALELARGTLAFLDNPAVPGAAWEAVVQGPAADPQALGMDLRAAPRPAALLAPAQGLAPPAEPQERLPLGARPPMATLPPGDEATLFALVPGAPMALEGHLHAVLELDGGLRVRTAEGERVFLSEAREETRTEGAQEVPVVGPVGGRQVTTSVVNTTYLELPGAALLLPANPEGAAPATVLLGQGLQVRVHGAAAFDDATGTVRVGSGEHRADRQGVLLGGDFVVAPRAWSQAAGQGQERPAWAPGAAVEGTQRAEFVVAGDLTYVQVEGGPGQGFAPLVAAGGAALGLAALLALVPAAKFGATKLLVLPLYTRLKKPEVLEQRRREQLLEAIRAQPGSNATELAQRLGMGWGNLVYHLGVLERERLVSSCREGRHRRFFPAGHVDHSLQPSLALLKNASAARVMDVIRAHPGLPQKQLSAQTGLSPSTINWHVERLSEAGLVWRRQEGREVQYYPSDLLHQLDPGEGLVAG